MALEEHVGGANGTVVVGVLGYMSNQSVEGRHEGLGGMGLEGSEVGRWVAASRMVGSLQRA